MLCKELVILAIAALVGMPTSDAVIGGNEYNKGAYPFHVSLWFMGPISWFTSLTPTKHLCGGTLVGEQWVLTSASCFEDTWTPTMADLSLWKVYVGAHAQSGVDTEAQYRTISQVFTAPDYNAESRSGDLVLLKLNTPVTLGNSVGLAKLNGKSDCPSVNQDAVAIGWGATKVNRTTPTGSNLPHEASVKVTDIKECQDRYESMRKVGIYTGNFQMDHRTICIGSIGSGVEACSGDEGSPLVSMCPGSNTPVVVGTYSHGASCTNPGFPSVYTRVSSYRQWIEDTITDNSL